MKTKKLLYFIICLIYAFSINAISQNQKTFGQHPQSKSNPDVPKVKLISSDVDNSVISFSFSEFELIEIETSRGVAKIPNIPETTPILEKDAPELPKITSSIVIPDKAEMQIEVISENFVDYSNIEIAPSKGNLSRDIDPATVPYNYGKVYQENEFFPKEKVHLRKPFILRDYRGQTVVVHPFRYNPVTKVLRFYKNLVVKVSKKSDNGVNPLVEKKSSSKVPAEFNEIYSKQFLNYSGSKYSPVSEEGAIMIISHGLFMDAMQPYIDWKTMAGRRVYHYDVSNIGDTSAIKSAVSFNYNNNNIAFLLLVGDAYQVPPLHFWGTSDNAYGFISGNDAYPEVFVGRFSAYDVADVETQVQRVLDYEINPVSSSWLKKGVGIASNQGAGIGDDGEIDWQHERLIRTDLLNYNYISIAELYEGSQGGLDAVGNPTAGMLINEINSGVGIINYTGHGWTYGLSTTGFTTSDVNALTNTGKLPFIWAVACSSGNFDGEYCLGEAFLRATHNGEPSGAVATLMSTETQAWAPPMDGQDEMVDILTESYSSNIKRTFGGISMNGCMHMNDAYGASGAKTTSTWNCFGDPSLVVRTSTPVIFSASHPNQAIVGSSLFTVNCVVDGALVALTQNGNIRGTGTINNGTVTISTTNPVTSLDTLFVTVTAYNHKPYFGYIKMYANTPDFFIMETSVNQTSFMIGDIMDISCEQHYSGISTVTKTPKVGYYLSNDILLSNDDILLSYDESQLNVNQTYNTETASLQIPANIPAGQYFVLFMADYNDAYVEYYESNNKAWEEIVISNYTANGDLVIQNYSVTPSGNLAPFQTITANYTVNYSGTNSSNMDVLVEVYLSPTATINAQAVYLGQLSASVSSSNSSDAETINLTIPAGTAAGNYFIQYRLDPDDFWEETNESNNIKNNSVTVNYSNIEDFYTTNATVSENIVDLGQSITVSSTQNYNGFVTSSQNLSVGYYLSRGNDYVFLGYGTAFLSVYQSTATVTSTIQIPTNVTPGSGYIEFVTDYDDSFTETNETNNVSAIAIEISYGDIRIENASVSPSTVQYGSGTIYMSADQVYSGYSGYISTICGFYISTDQILDAGDNLMQVDHSYIGNTSPVDPVSASISVSGYAPGNYYAIFKADYDDYYTEADEANNIDVVPFTIAFSCTDALEPNDSWNTAYSIGTSTSYSNSNLCLEAGDYDFFSFVHNSQSYYFKISNYWNSGYGYYGLNFTRNGDDVTIQTYETNGDCNTYIVLYGTDHTSVLDTDNDGGTGEFSLINFDLENDFYIENESVTPTTIAQGGEITVNCVQHYSGPGIQNMGSYVGYFLSTNTTYETSDVYLGYDPSQLSASSTFQAETETLTIPPSISTGNYYILFVANYDNYYFESNYNNNTEYVAISVTAACDDVYITNMSASPMPVAPSSSLTITCDQVYSGISTSSQTSMIKYYFSDNITYESSDTYIGYDVSSLSYNANIENETISYTIPSNTVGGIYYILMLADANNSISECNENNNLAYIEITVDGAIGDLSVQNCSLSQNTANPGESLTVSCIQLYSGTSTVPINSYVGFYLSTNTTYESSDILLGQEYSTLHIGNTSEAESELVTIPGGTSAGTYYILFYADHSGYYAETNESNNIQFQQITIGTACEDVFITNMAATPNPVDPGANLTISCIQNYTGSNTSQLSVTVKYFLSENNTYESSDTYIGYDISTFTSSITSTSEEINYNIPANTTAGTYYILFDADANDVVSECNENNNIAFIQINVSGGIGDLTIQNPAVAPSSVEPGNNVTISCEQHYAGSSSLPINSYVGYYFSDNTTYESSDTYLGSDYSALHAGNTSDSYSKTITINSNTSAGTYYILFIADYNEYFLETNESNNLAYAQLVVQNNICTDALEPNNNQSQAYDIGTSSSFYNNNLCISPGDEDWFKFTANGDDYYFKVKGFNSSTNGDYGLNFLVQNNHISISTFEVNGSTDTKLYLYDENLTNIEYNDDYNGTVFSYILWIVQGSISGDFTIQNASVTDNTISEMDWIDISCTQAFSGNISYNSYPKVGFFLSADQSFDSSDTWLGEEQSALGNGTYSENESSQLWLPWATPGGSYYVLCVADFNNMYLETNENNNVASVAITVLGQPSWNLNLWGTGDMHSIMIPDSSNILINGNPIEAGDYIGVFYDSSGTLACGGYMMMYDGWGGMIDAVGADFGNDGFAAGEEFKWKIWDASEDIEYIAIASYDTDSFPNAGNFVSWGWSGLSALVAGQTPPQTQIQNILMNVGWSIFSTYINPAEMDMNNIISDISSNTELIKDGNGNVLWPAWGINLIGNINIGEGYQVKMISLDTLDVSGTIVDPASNSINVPLGWSIIGYLRTSSAPIDNMLGTYSANIELVKNGAGNVYWPAWNVNLIGNMNPGEGYQIKTSQSFYLTYPSNNQLFALLKTNDITVGNYFAKNTGSNMTLMIPNTAWESKPDLNSYIKIYTNSGLLVGFSQYSGENTAITIWGDDETSSEIDGLTYNEKFYLMLDVDGIENLYSIDLWLEGDSKYANNKIAIAANLVIDKCEKNLFEIYPNPFKKHTNIEFFLVENSEIELSVYSLTGDKIKILEKGYKNSGHHNIIYNQDNLESGIYYLKLKSKTRTLIKQICVLK